MKAAMAGGTGFVGSHPHRQDTSKTDIGLDTRRLSGKTARGEINGGKKPFEPSYCAWGKVSQRDVEPVDRNRQLFAHSGWINFRMRAMLVSGASCQLWLHWRESSLHLARLFVDYEPVIHYPQVQMQSGTTGINSLRIYKPIKQSVDQDSGAVFIRAWVPELAGIDSPSIHNPWLMSESEQRRFGLRIGEHYPNPLVDHQEAAREARRRIQGARSGAGRANAEPRYL